MSTNNNEFKYFFSNLDIILKILFEKKSKHYKIIEMQNSKKILIFCNFGDFLTNIHIYLHTYVKSIKKKKIENTCVHR